MKFIIGKKIEMTQVWQGDKLVVVTRVQAGPCPVVQVKTVEKDGYQSVQLGFDEKKEKNIRKPQLGHLNKIPKIKDQKPNINLKYLREFRCEVKDLKIGDMIDVSIFNPGDNIQVVGASKGRGFAGSVKRHGFHGHNTTHGTKDQVRTSGSIGASGPQHVFKGTRMPGRMGGNQVTVKNLEVIEIDQANNILLVKGAVPGARNSLVLISGEGELKVNTLNTPSDTKETPKDAKVQAEESKPKAEEKIETVPAKKVDDSKQTTGDSKPLVEESKK